MNKEIYKMKQVKIGGQLVEFSSLDQRQNLTEERNPNFLGYFSEYYINGALVKLNSPAKFYK